MTTNPLLDCLDAQLLLTLKEYIDATTFWRARAAVLSSKGFSPAYPTSERDKQLRERFLRAEAGMNAAIDSKVTQG